MSPDPVAAIDDAMTALRERVAEAVAAGNMPIGKAPRLGDLIAQRRKALGLSLEDVARGAGCTKSHVWEMEQDRSRNPTVAMVWALAKALSTPFSMMAASALASALGGGVRP